MSALDDLLRESKTNSRTSATTALARTRSQVIDVAKASAPDQYQQQLDDVTSLIVEIESYLIKVATRFAVRFEFQLDPELVLKDSLSGMEQFLGALALAMTPHDYASITKVKGQWGLYYVKRQGTEDKIVVPYREAPADKKRLFMNRSEEFVEKYNTAVEQAKKESGLRTGMRALEKLKAITAD